MRTSIIALLMLIPWSGTAQNATSESLNILDAARDRMSRQNDAWYRTGEFLPIIQSQEILVAVNPKDEETWDVLIWMYQNVEMPDLQWTATRRFASANPSYIDAKYYEANFMFAKKLYAKIPALLEPLISQSPPPDPNAFRFLAHSYNRMGYYEDALRVWDVYIKIKPKDLQAIANRKGVAEKMKKQ